MKKQKIIETIIGFVVYFGIALAIFMTALFVKRPWEYETRVEQVQYYSDCFIIPAAVMGGVFLLTLFARWGAFDALGFSAKFIVNQFLPTGMMKTEKYYDYKKRKAAKRKRIQYECLVVALLFLLVSLVFYLLYQFYYK